MVGPPGAGKSMLAARLPGILPSLEPCEALELGMIQSVAGGLRRGELTREPGLIIFCAARCPAAGRFGEMTASARVHRRDQLEPGRVGDVPLGAGDADVAGLQRLAKRFKCRAVELWQLVEQKQPHYTNRTG